VTPYLDDLARLPKLGYLDMGMASQMRRARAAVPEARRAVLYSPVKIQDASPDEIRADIARIYDDLAPCDLVLADIQASTPDRRVRDVVALCEEVAARPRRSA
jgi:hypothetical protein